MKYPAHSTAAGLNGWLTGIYNFFVLLLEIEASIAPSSSCNFCWEVLYTAHCAFGSFCFKIGRSLLSCVCVCVNPNLNMNCFCSCWVWNSFSSSPRSLLTNNTFWARTINSSLDFLSSLSNSGQVSADVLLGTESFKGTVSWKGSLE